MFTVPIKSRITGEKEVQDKAVAKRQVVDFSATNPMPFIEPTPPSINASSEEAISTFAVFSASTNGLLWLGQAATLEEAVRSLNREVPIVDTEPSDNEEFLSVVEVSPAEAEKLDALEWGAPVPELVNEFTEVSYATALEIVAGSC